MSSNETLAKRLIEEGLKPVRKALADAGIRVSPWTAIRWARVGVRGKRLDAVKAGGVWMTTDAAVRRFLETSTHVQRPIKPFSRAVSRKAVGRYLEEIGLGRTER